VNKDLQQTIQRVKEMIWPWTKHVLLGIGGGIAAYKLAFLASRLVQSGGPRARRHDPERDVFVGALTFEGLTGSKAILSSTQVDPDGSVPHIDAARWARVYVIAPASARRCSRNLARGAADDPVSLLAITCRCPILVCPAMNDAMWTAAAVQDNCGDPAPSRRRAARAACKVTWPRATTRSGRMVEPESIQTRIEAVLAGAR
jgi:phosphopantothenoylcysteine decarboxylase/phosphopantothenate--cysteine ligase